MLNTGVHGIMYLDRGVGMKKLNHDDIQNRINNVHGENVFILKEPYVNQRTKVDTLHTICNNVWKASVISLSNGHGCPFCANNIKKTQEQIVDEVKRLTNGEYEVLSEYTGTHGVLTFKHLTCGNVFDMTANSFLRGQRCPKERYERVAKSNSVPLEVAQEMMLKSTNGEYEIKGNYKGLYPRKNGKAKILHKTCGSIFETQPSRIINRISGCPICSESHGERIVRDFLIEHNIPFEREYRIKECKNKRALPFDFAVIENGELKCLIEYDGEQHFKPKFGEIHFKNTVYNDGIKNQFCKDNNIDLIRIPYKRGCNNKRLKEYIYNTLYNKLIPSQA